ncbi:hypothetical protein GGR58DRAFT_451708 [Xylaria digitata]|nr:hypothetical protein GGR58DRAFT_451708 [Xylaria digitata]
MLLIRVLLPCSLQERLRCIRTLVYKLAALQLKSLGHPWPNVAMFGIFSTQTTHSTPTTQIYAPKTDNKPRRHTACDGCRLSKIRCDGEKPSCGKCISLSRPCIYSPSRKKRKSHTAATPVPSDFEAEDWAKQLPVADTSEHESAESVTEHSDFPSVNFDTPPWEYSDSINETIGVEPSLQQNENDNVLSIGIDLDSWSFPAIDPSVGTGDAGLAGLPSMPLAPIEDDKNEEFPIPKQSLLTQAPASPRSVYILDSVMGSAGSTGEEQHQPAHMLGEPQGLDAKMSSRSCECLGELVYSLFNCDLWDATEAVSSAINIQALPALSITAYLSLFRDSMNAWNKIRNCHLSCGVRREAALLCILNLNRVVKAQLHLVTKLSCVESCNLSSLAEEDSIRIGAVLIDNSLDWISMLRGLVHSHIDRLRAAVQTFREEWMGAGLNDCCAKLDLISLDLAS